MASQADLADLAKRTANTTFDARVVETARLDEIEGSDGDPVIRVRLIGTEQKIDELDGDQLLDANIAISQEFRKAGESLRIVVEYADQQELEALGSD